MNSVFTLLIADRNRNVREFLRREFMADGYRVLAAGDGREVLSIIDGEAPPDLLILDMEVPYVSGLSIIEQLGRRKPRLPVVIHTFLTDGLELDMRNNFAFVEKSGNTDCLKAAVAEVLKKSYPERFQRLEEEHQGCVPPAGS